jgi:hypothetical protein
MSILGEEYSRRAPAVRKPRLGIKLGPPSAASRKTAVAKMKGLPDTGSWEGAKNTPRVRLGRPANSCWWAGRSRHVQRAPVVRVRGAAYSISGVR